MHDEPALATAVLVRDATVADMAAVQAVYAQHVRDGLGTFEEVPPTTEEMAARREAVLAMSLPYMVAESGGRVVGYCYGGSFRAREAYRFTVEDSIYIDREFQGRGVGSALLGELIARCEAGPWRQMLALIGDSGNAGSIALHRKFGFRSVGSMKAVGFKLGRWVDVVILQRPLGPGSSTLPRL